jgi:alpha-galactosidase
MIKKPKIVLIGAGSVSFGLSCVRDAFTTKELWGSELVFVDLDRTAVERSYKAADRINKELNAGYKLWYTNNRCEALPGADFIITSIAVNRNELWKLDFQIPQKYGVKHVLGENGGPGAVFHTMRNIPIILDICKDIEKLCPNALLINFTNPESRICLAISKYTKVRAVGLCHQIHCGLSIVGKMLGLGMEDIDAKAAGLNHFTWMLDIRNKHTGEDLYPVLCNVEPTIDPEYEKLSRFMFHRFGLFPTSGDGHLGEYLPYAHEMMSIAGYDFEESDTFRKYLTGFVELVGNGSVPLDVEFQWYSLRKKLMSPSGEQAFNIIRGMCLNTNEYIISANLPNRGYIKNLPDDAVVEIPAMASGLGVNGLAVGELPQGIASLCINQINVQKLVVEAGATGNRDLALQALLVDSNVPGAEAAVGIFNELMELNRP